MERAASHNWKCGNQKVDERNRVLWKLGIVEKLIPGKDGVVRAMQLRNEKSYLEMAVQHL